MDQEWGDGDRAVRYGVTDSIGRHKLQLGVFRVRQDFPERFPQFPDGIPVNSNGREVPHPGNERGDVIGSSLFVLVFRHKLN